jgi:RNase P/RNase MRP subunit POP5
MQALSSSQKENKRYLLLKGKNLKENVEKAILEFIGILGTSKASLAWIKTGKDSAIISINRGSLNHIRASFTASNHDIKVVRVSGTLRGLNPPKTF